MWWLWLCVWCFLCVLTAWLWLWLALWCLLADATTLCCVCVRVGDERATEEWEAPGCLDTLGLLVWLRLCVGARECDPEWLTPREWLWLGSGECECVLAAECVRVWLRWAVWEAGRECVPVAVRCAVRDTPVVPVREPDGVADDDGEDDAEDVAVTEGDVWMLGSSSTTRPGPPVPPPATPPTPTPVW